ncbi:MAG: MATE family efflux transporter [Sphaerochaetaceae bacterium]
MSKINTKNLTVGSLNSHILRLSFPTMIGMLLQAVYDLVDMIWIGFISPSAIAAMTLFSTFFWFVEVLNEIVGTSSVSLLAQSYGAADEQRVTKVASQTLLFKFVLATGGAILLALALKPLFSFFTSDTEVITYGLQYGLIRTLFLPVFFSSYSVNTIFRSTGDAKTPMKLLIVTAIINMVADPLVMFDTIPGTRIKGLGWGIRGAAIATVFSISIAFLAGLILLLKGKAGIKIRFRDFFHLDKITSYKLITIGLPAGLNLLLRNFSMFIFLRLVAIYGTKAIAVAGIAFRIYSFGMMPSWGLMMGSGVIIGHNLGAERLDRALKAVRLSTIDCLLFVSLIALPILLFPSQILALFMGGAPPSMEGISLMWVIAPALLTGAAKSGMWSAFTGAGKNQPLLIASIIGQWLIMVPFALIATLVVNAPIIWLWLAIVIGDLGELLITIILYNKIDWISHRV